MKSNQLNYYHRNKDKISIRSKIYRKKFRTKVLTHYSGIIPFCNCCGETIYEFLSIDHIKGDGRKHRENIKMNIDRWLVKNNYPNGFQVLCHNCNLAKGLYGKCPHGE